jgi:hypothetical protein
MLPCAELPIALCAAALTPAAPPHNARNLMQRVVLYTPTLRPIRTTQPDYSTHKPAWK